MHIVLPVWAESAWAVAPWPMQLHARMSQLAAQCLSGEGFVLLVLQSSHLTVTYMARDSRQRHRESERDALTHIGDRAGPGPGGRAAPSADIEHMRENMGRPLEPRP